MTLREIRDPEQAVSWLKEGEPVLYQPGDETMYRLLLVKGATDDWLLVENFEVVISLYEVDVDRYVRARGPLNAWRVFRPLFAAWGVLAPWETNRSHEPEEQGASHDQAREHDARVSAGDVKRRERM